MSRLMSVAYTADAVIERRKTVTRRLGWLFAQPGDRVTLCRKVMGRKAGEPLVRLAEVQLVSVRRERLWTIALDPLEVEREGFAGWTTGQFLDFFRTHMRVGLQDWITRIEWRYLSASLPQPDPETSPRAR